VPISILNYTGKDEGEKPDKLDWLCGEEWELPALIECLEKWLESTGKNYKPGTYVADIGFGPREGACGGGGVLTQQSMAIMVSIGMNLFLSEYPAMEKKSE
jgi:hypothetical protein